MLALQEVLSTMYILLPGDRPQSQITDGATLSASTTPDDHASSLVQHIYFLWSVGVGSLLLGDLSQKSWV